MFVVNVCDKNIANLQKTDTRLQQNRHYFTVKPVICLEAKGAVIHIDVWNGNVIQVYTILHTVTSVSRVDHLLQMPLLEFSRLFDVAEYLIIKGKGPIAPLVKLLDKAPDSGETVRVVDFEGRPRLRWQSKGENCQEDLPLPSFDLFSRSGVSFVTDIEIWEKVRPKRQEQGLLGVVEDSGQGYLSIRTSKPFIVQNLGLPALFQLRDNEFGVPRQYKAHLSHQDLTWSGTSTEKIVTVPDSVLAMFTHDMARDVESIAHGLENYRTVYLDWKAGMGRRIGALGGMLGIGLKKIIIVCPTYAKWVWYRHFQHLSENSVGCVHCHRDFLVVGYDELATPLPAAEGYIFDDLEWGLKRYSQSALSFIESVAGDKINIKAAATGSWPTSLEDQHRVMSALRPREFRHQHPVPYPTGYSIGLRDHIRAYGVTRASDHEQLERGLVKRSTSFVVEPGHEFKELLTTLGSEQQTLAIQQGVENLSSPRLGGVLSYLQAHPGSPIAVVAEAEYCPMLTAIVGAEATVISEDAAKDLTDFERVLFYRPTFTYTVIDTLVGTQAALSFPQEVAVLYVNSPGETSRCLCGAITTQQR